MFKSIKPIQINIEFHYVFSSLFVADGAFILNAEEIFIRFFTYKNKKRCIFIQNHLQYKK